MWGVVAGGIITILITIWIESLRRPRLSLKIEQPPLDVAYPSSHPAQNVRTLRLVLSNEALPHWARWMVNAPALQCRAAITFHHLDGQDVFGQVMEGRWAASPQPVAIPIVDPQGQTLGHIFDFDKIGAGSRMDVYPGEHQILDTCIRADDDVECFGWNNESYFSTPVWRNPRWRLGPGRYLVKVSVASSGHKRVDCFRLLNDLDRAHFRLEPATYDDRSKLGL
jgi:hypothetical protein